MALQSEIQPGRARFSNLPSAGNRAAAFRDAKRHSRFVAFLRVALPVLALGLTSLYFIPTDVTVEFEGGEANIDTIEVSQGGLKMVNPRINGIHEKHGTYDIRAIDATQQIQNPDLITLNQVSASLTSREERKTTLTAPSGIFHSKKEELTFTEGVDIGGDAGYSGKLKSASVFIQSNKLISTEPVEFSFYQNTIQADSMTLFSSDRRAIFEGRVRVHLKRTPEADQQ